MNSKARLLIACEALTDDALVEYFPAYEIVNDDLRDYRFYEADMIHPSAVAADYILEKFLDRYVSERDKQILAQGEKIYRRLAHRNMATDAESTINRFNDETEALVKSFMAANPGMCFPTL
jgi:transposase